jgi:uncharacterized membrane protein YdjX (TVP38/TMEM64 family)
MTCSRIIISRYRTLIQFRTSENFRQYAKRLGVPGPIPSTVLVNIQVVYSFCPFSVAIGSTQPVPEKSTKELP